MQCHKMHIFFSRLWFPIFPTPPSHFSMIQKWLLRSKVNLYCHISVINFLANEAKFGIFPGEVLTSPQSMRRRREGGLDTRSCWVPIYTYLQSLNAGKRLAVSVLCHLNFAICTCQIQNCAVTLGAIESVPGSLSVLACPWRSASFCKCENSVAMVTTERKHRHAQHAKVIFSARWVEMGHCVPNVFIFVTEKEHNSQTDENIALLHLKGKKKT